MVFKCFSFLFLCFLGCASCPLLLWWSLAFEPDSASLEVAGFFWRSACRHLRHQASEPFRATGRSTCDPSSRNLGPRLDRTISLKPFRTTFQQRTQSFILAEAHRVIIQSRALELIPCRADTCNLVAPKRLLQVRTCRDGKRRGSTSTPSGKASNLKPASHLRAAVGGVELQGR